MRKRETDREREERNECHCLYTFPAMSYVTAAVQITRKVMITTLGSWIHCN